MARGEHGLPLGLLAMFHRGVRRRCIRYNTLTTAASSVRAMMAADLHCTLRVQALIVKKHEYVTISKTDITVERGTRRSALCTRES